MEVTLYKPRDYQKIVHDAITKHMETYKKGTEDFQKVFVIKSPRQIGKTLLVENELLRFALMFQGSMNSYLSPTYSLGKDIFDELCNAANQVIKRHNKVDLIIEFINGSKIQFFSAEQRDTLRGRTVTGLLVIDEASKIPDNIYYELVNVWTDAHKAVTIIISTPKFKRGFFYDLYLDGLSKGLTFDLSGYDFSEVRSEAKMEELRKITPEKIYKSEYLGLFLDLGDSLFKNMDTCTIDSVTDYNELYLGLDFGTGSGKDFTVLTALNENGEQVFIHSWNDLSPVEQIEKINEILLPLKSKIKGFVAEQNSIGKIYISMLDVLGVQLTPFNTTNESKRKLVEGLQVAFEQNKIKILNDLTQLNQLSMYEAKINTITNSVSYNAPSGQHDDIVIALMLAYHGYSGAGCGSFYVPTTKSKHRYGRH